MGTVLKGSPLFQTEPSWTLRNHGNHKSGSLSLTYYSPKVKDNLIGQLGEEEGCNGQAEEHRMQGVQRPQLLWPKSNTGVDNPQPRTADGSNPGTILTSIYCSVAQKLWYAALQWVISTRKILKVKDRSCSWITVSVLTASHTCGELEKYPPARGDVWRVWGWWENLSTSESTARGGQ